MSDSTPPQGTRLRPHNDLPPERARSVLPGVALFGFDDFEDSVELSTSFALRAAPLEHLLDYPNAYDFVLVRRATAHAAKEIAAALRVLGRRGPIVLISCWEDDASQEFARRAGASECLAHPTDPLELAATLRSLAVGSTPPESAPDAPGLLTASERKLFKKLMSSPSRFIAYRDAPVAVNTLHQAVKGMRPKLGAYAFSIENVRADGFRLLYEGAASRSP